MSMQSISPAPAPSQFSYPAAAAATTPSYFPFAFHLQNANYSLWPATTAPAAAPAYNTVYPMPQLQQAQLLFQKGAQIIIPEALASVKAAIASSEKDKKVEATKKAIPRKAAGQSWEDPTLADWPESMISTVNEDVITILAQVKELLVKWDLGRLADEILDGLGGCDLCYQDDFRLFCGDLGNEVNDDILSKAFSKYPSFNKARVIRDKWTGKTKGYGFVSFAKASDLAAVLKEMNGKYVGNRPIKLRKSTWKNRIDYEALEKRNAQPQKKLKSQKSVLHK